MLFSMHFGKFTSFLRCLRFRDANQKRIMSTVEGPRDIVQRYLGLDDTQTTNFIKANNLVHVDDESLIESITRLSSLGYSRKDILQHGSLLKSKPRRLQDHYLVLQESGFHDITLMALRNFRKLTHKKVRTLKTLDFIHKDVDVANNLLMHLNPKPTDFVLDFNDEDILAQIHSKILRQYLKWRLQATSDEIERFFRIYRYLKFKSFHYLCENIKFAISIGLMPRQLLSFGYILVNNPNYSRRTLEEMPHLAGTDLKVEMRKYPKLTSVAPKNFKKIYELLKDYDIPDTTIQKSMNIFTLSPKTIGHRLEEIKKIPEMNVFRSNTNILRLIIHYNRARSRLTFLQQIQHKCASMALLGSDNEKHFDGRIKDCQDVNLIRDVVGLLSYMLKADPKVIKMNLKKHPCHLQVPMVDIEKTVQFLQENFSNTSIVKVLPIVLYPSSKIKEILKHVSTTTDYPKHLTETRKLNLVLYLMEKNHHFTGNGVWAERVA